MSLSFPNRSRSYDASARRIRFIGHDGMFEVPFLVDADVFPNANTEAGYLALEALKLPVTALQALLHHRPAP